MQAGLYRILDANLNRAREGLRVVEEIVRLVWEQAALQRRLKQVRHGIAQAERGLAQQLLIQHRAAYRDPGARVTSATEKKRLHWQDLLRANLRRTEEALRVLEEVAKLISGPASQQFKRWRFRTYDLEQEILLKIQRDARRSIKTRK